MQQMMMLKNIREKLESNKNVDTKSKIVYQDKKKIKESMQKNLMYLNPL